MGIGAMLDWWQVTGAVDCQIAIVSLLDGVARRLEVIVHLGSSSNRREEEGED